ncbi:hypothetical protein GCM10010412_088700 [Nonomuraea recticatena]|uniref:HNH endonuclease n=1 Tax=Nonomuraea recticatena TaxID=46178 RepID=A0ABP6FMJ3_9ACTN
MAEDRHVAPWSDNGEQRRGWADEQVNQFLDPDKHLVDADARNFARGSSIESDRSYRPPPRGAITWVPRRDLIWEPGSQQDLARLHPDDAVKDHAPRQWGGPDGPPHCHVTG